MIDTKRRPLIDGISEEDRQAATLLVTATVLLLLFEYWGRPGFYASSGVRQWVAEAGGGRFADLADAAAYLWWGLSSLLWRVLVPLGVGVWLLRLRPSELGYRVEGISRHLPVYGVVYLVMLPVLIWVSGFQSFGSYYPFYARAAQGGAGLWVYWVGYSIQFVGVEAFFRGFMTFGLARRFGWLAVPIMTVPYTMIHFAKPMPEAVAAIVAGLGLGALALRSRSWVPGVFLHVAVALTMDVLVLARAGAMGGLL
ncbi:MAG: CPBP family glutamic-type intramembrane protease [Acidimicrobiia bacterium]